MCRSRRGRARPGRDRRAAEAAIHRLFPEAVGEGDDKESSGLSGGAKRLRRSRWERGTRERVRRRAGPELGIRQVTGGPAALAYHEGLIGPMWVRKLEEAARNVD